MHLPVKNFKAKGLDNGNDQYAVNTKKDETKKDGTIISQLL